MKYLSFNRIIILSLIVTVLALAVNAQSGRRRQVNPPPTSNQNTQEADRNTDRQSQGRQPADKPLPDNTPVNVGDDGTIKLETALVTIPVSVIDREGRFIPNLIKRDFRIYEDGVEQDIESFESVEVPFHVVLLLDTSASTRFRLEDIQAAAVEFVNQLRYDDKVMVVSFDSSVKVECDFSSDRSMLRRAIYQTRTGGSTKLYEAVDLSLDEAFRDIQGRKAIVLFTDGVDTASRRSTASSTIQQVEESDVLVFPIRYDTESDNPQGGGVIIGNPRGNPLPWPMPGPRNPRTPRTGGSRWPWPFISYQFPGQWPQGGRLPGPGGGDYRKAEVYLQDLADRSGGRLYFADTLQNLSDSFSNIAEELRHQYALSYYPSNSNRDGTFRAIKVRVNRTGGIVRARSGYRATPDTQAQTNNNQRDDRKRPEFKRRQLAGTN